MTIVAKFGGTSVSTATKLRQVHRLVRANPERKYVVVSAAGKRHADDQKITDLLRECARLRKLRLPHRDILQMVFDRHSRIVSDLSLDLDLRPEYEAIGNVVETGAGTDYLESRGEYLMGKIVARMLDRPFVDPTEFITFDKKGLVEFLTYDRAGVVFGEIKTAVIPGYYGGMLRDPREIKVFSRGGSDITGAIVARAVGAELYENCTDVFGVLAADPRIVDGPVTIARMTYQEARELAYMGAGVLHPDALFPIQEKCITTRVLNTAHPDGPYTDIVQSVLHRSGWAVGVAGRKGFSAISIARSSMNTEIGFSWKILGILKDAGVSYEHMPGGLDSISLIIDDHMLDGKLSRIVGGIVAAYPKAEITVKNNLAMIAVVGEGMVHAPGTAARLFGSLFAEKVNVVMINQGASEMVIGIGVDSADYEKAIRTIYRDCIEK